MSDIKHTPEPWFYGSYGNLLIVGNYKGEPDKHNVIASLGPQHFPSNTVEYENAERIIDCVNACVGMENPAAELAALRTLPQQQAEQIAELVDYVVSLRGDISDALDKHYDNEKEKCGKFLRHALAKPMPKAMKEK